MRELQAGRVHRLLIVAAIVLLVVAGLPALPAAADTYFPQTGYTVWGPFEAYWQQNGGLAQFGLPRTSVYPAGPTYDAQWFERGLFTFNPANPKPYQVELQLLGSMITADRRNEQPFQPAPAMMSPGAQHFSQTQHNLSGKFQQYWQQTGGLAIYGYPISEVFQEQSKSDGKLYAVQYFERNRFELHPELAGTKYEVQLGLLGSEMIDKLGGPAAFANKGKPAFYPPPTGNSSSPAIPPGGTVVSPGAGGTGGQQSSPAAAAPALPATTSRVLFSDDFSSGSLSGWQPSSLKAPQGTLPAGWIVREGMVLQTATDSAGSNTDDEAYLMSKAGPFADFTLDAEAYATSSEPVGLVFRQGPGGFYLLRLYGQTGTSGGQRATLSWASATGGGVVSASTAWPGYKAGVWTRLTVKALGSALAVQVDGQTILTATDTHFAQGAIGLYAYADGSARFDNVRVTQP